MKYRVRNKDGELEFASFGEVERFWLMGLIDPDDELLEDGHTVWRKASSFPLLMNAERSGETIWAGTWFLWTCIGVLGGSAALWLFHDKNYVAGLLVAVVVAAVMIHITNRAFQKRKPHQNLGKR